MSSGRSSRSSAPCLSQRFQCARVLASDTAIPRRRNPSSRPRASSRVSPLAIVTVTMPEAPGASGRGAPTRESTRPRAWAGPSMRPPCGIASAPGASSDPRVAALNGAGLEGLGDPVCFSVGRDPDSGGAAEDLVLGGHRGRVELAEGAVAVSSGEDASVPDDVCARQRDLLGWNGWDEADEARYQRRPRAVNLCKLCVDSAKRDPNHCREMNPDPWLEALSARRLLLGAHLLVWIVL